MNDFSIFIYSLSRIEFMTRKNTWVILLWVLLSYGCLDDGTAPSYKVLASSHTELNEGESFHFTVTSDLQSTSSRMAPTFEALNSLNGPGLFHITVGDLSADGTNIAET